MIDYAVASVSDFSDTYLKSILNSLPQSAYCRICEKKSKALNESLAALAVLKKLCLKNGLSFDKLSYSEKGKPLLPVGFISISHSFGFVAAAVSDNPVGIDIEYIREIRRRQSYKLFSREESLFVNSDNANISERFLLCWTRKEAYIKLYGEGILSAAGINLLNPPPNLKIITECYNQQLIISVCRLINEDVNI